MICLCLLLSLLPMSKAEVNSIPIINEVQGWTCSQCGNENPAWRSRCTVCLSSKKDEGDLISGTYVTSDN